MFTLFFILVTFLTILGYPNTGICQLLPGVDPEALRVMATADPLKEFVLAINLAKDGKWLLGIFVLTQACIPVIKVVGNRYKPGWFKRYGMYVTIGLSLIAAITGYCGGMSLEAALAIVPMASILPSWFHDNVMSKSKKQALRGA